MAAAALAAVLSPVCSAGWWAENDYTFGSGKLQHDSLTLYRNSANGRFTSGLNASFYKDGGAYKDKVFSFRAPLIYSAPSFLASFRPFVYPVAQGARAGAGGAKASVMTSLTEDGDQGYLHLSLAGALARQRAFVQDGAAFDRQSFTQGSAELQLDKSFYNQFFFLLSAAGFSKPSSGIDPRGLRSPVLDQNELAYLGTFRTVTALPEWTLSVQAARSMKPEFDSHIYAGYSKISFRRAAQANSAVMGMKLGLNDNSSLDLAYNAYKEEGAAWRNYYKLLLQVFF